MIPIDLRFWRLEQPEDRLSALSSYLNAAERQRADRFAKPQHSKHFICARGRLREILSEYLGQHPSRVPLRTAVHGKPTLEKGPAFNLSHAGGWAALAVGPDHWQIGIDIEAHRPVEDGLAQRFFSPTEVASLRALPEQKQHMGFFTCWTRKEAVVKALGTGLSLPLDSFDVTVSGPARLTRIAEGHPDFWRMSALETGSGFSGALAVTGGGERPPPFSLTIREGRLPLA